MRETDVLSESNIANSRYISQIMFFSTLWTCGIWAPFQLFIRTYQVFSPQMGLNLTILGIFVLGALFIQWILRDHPLRSVFTGLFSMILFGTIALCAPILFPIHYILMITSSCLTMGGFVQIWIYESIERPEFGKLRHIWTMEMSMSMGIGVGWFFILLYIVPRNEYGPFMAMLIMAIIAIGAFLVTKNYFRKEWHFARIVGFNRTRALERITTVNYFISILITFIVSVAFISFILQFYFVLLNEGLEFNLVVFTIGNIFAGAGLIILLYIKELFGRILRYTYVFIAGMILLLTYYIGIGLNPYPAFNPGLGVACCLISFYFLREIANYSKDKVGGGLLVLIWCIAGYISGFPPGEALFIQYQYILPWAVAGMIVLEVVAQLLRYFFVPSIFDTKAYLKTLELLQTKKK